MKSQKIPTSLAVIFTLVYTFGWKRCTAVSRATLVTLQETGIETNIRRNEEQPVDNHGGNIYQFDRKLYDFSANLHPDGIPEGVKKAIIESVENCEAYPDPSQGALRSALGSFHGIDPSCICCGNGADDVIYRICLAFRPKRALVIAPTFTEYAKALETADCDVEHFLLTERNGFRAMEDVVSTIKAGAYDMVFLCNPNNPTGIPIDTKRMMSIIYASRYSGARIIIDECFMEFVLGMEEYTVLPKIESLPGAIILKSFTKLFAMAGIRLGYCICGDVKDAESIGGCLQTWPVNTLAVAAGLAALQETDRFESTCVYIALERERLMGALIDLGFRTYGSQANYVFFWSPIPLDDALLEYDILIRNCSNYEGLGAGYYRVAVRSREENQILVEALTQIMKK